jgi:TP901 family phage tail tape measure protein
MADKVGNLYVDIGGDSSGFQSAAKSVMGTTDGLMGKFAALSGIIGATFSFNKAISGAIDFDKSLKNIQAVTGATDAKMALMNQQILDIGKNSIAGPQAVANAMYDIVGGVADASTHMAILKAAIATSEAGAADLSVTTQGLISVMNAYGLTAEQASFASDVFTQTVGKGVGSMDEFVAAMSPLAGLSAKAGIGFDDMGAMMAYMTAKGTSAAGSATQLKAATTAFLKPSDAMTKALKKAGFESGSAAIKQLGLAGTIQVVNKALGGSADKMAQALGSVEALQAASVLAGDDYTEFSDTFKESMDGITESARNVQLEAFSAKFDVLKNKLEAFGIQIGQAVLPVLGKLVDWASNGLDKLSKFTLDDLAKGLQDASTAAGQVVQIFGFGVTTALLLASVAGSNLLNIVKVLVVDGLQKASATAGQIVQLVGLGVTMAFLAASVAASNLLNIVKTLVADGLQKASTAAGQLLTMIGLGVSGGLLAASIAAQNLAGILKMLIADGLQKASTSAQQLVVIVGLGVFGALTVATTAASNFASVLKNEVVGAIAKIDPQVFGYLAAGVVILAGVLTVMKVATAIEAITTALTAMGAAGVLALVPMLPLLGVFALIVGLILLAATNTGGFRDRLNELHDTLTVKIPAAFDTAKTKVAEFMLSIQNLINQIEGLPTITVHFATTGLLHSSAWAAMRTRHLIQARQRHTLESAQMQPFSMVRLMRVAVLYHAV